MPSKCFDLSGKRIWVAGHRGMLGSAMVRRLSHEGCRMLTVGREELDLTRQEPVERWLDAHRPDAVVLCAARVGGIHANSTFPADFLFINLMIGANIVAAAHRVGVTRLLNVASACMYPRAAVQPMSEAALLTGPLEPTNEPYAIAKIATVKLIEAYRRQLAVDFVSAVPTNLYGIGDDFDPLMSHVAPALMRRMVEARDRGDRSVVIWGTGTPRRELMFVDDCADALAFVLEHYTGSEPINIGTGEEVTIRELAEATAAVVGYRGELVFDASKPDGAPRKLLDSSRLASLGWRGGRKLADGLGEMYRWYSTKAAVAD